MPEIVFGNSVSSFPGTADGRAKLGSKAANCLISGCFRSLNRVTSSTGNLSALAGSALAGGAVARVRADQPTQPVDPTDPVRDPTSSEYRAVQELKQRDREVRQHEQAHIAAGGSHVRGGAQYQYERGPDGRFYAVGGEVQIDTAPVPGDPAATIRKLEAVQRAASAPADPSGQDRSVAAAAARGIAEARAELQGGAPESSDGHDRNAPDQAEGTRVRNALSAYRDAASADAGQLLDLIA